MAFSKDKVMPVLNRDDILTVSDIVIERVSVPEWGGDVLVKGITGKERGKFEARLIINPGKKQKINMVDMRATLCSLAIVDESGKKLFTPADIKRLNEKSADPLNRVFEVAQRLAGLDDDDVEELTEGLQDNPFADSALD